MVVKLRNRFGTTDSTSQALSKSSTTGLGMLLAISAAFIILTSPAVIANAVWPNSTIPLEIFIAFGALQNLNHAINGILYCIVGSRFRNELKKLFKCKTRDSIDRSYTGCSSVKSSGALTIAFGTSDSTPVFAITLAASPNEHKLKYLGVR